MEEKDLSLYEIRTDLVEDIINNVDKNNVINKEIYEKGNIKVSNINVLKEQEELIGKKSGFYTTIYFEDITDKDNLSEVESIFIKELKKIFNISNIKDDDTCMIIGLGNDKSTPDSLGTKVVDKTIVTKHIYELVGYLEEGYRVVSSFSPGVMGTTGIETSDILKGIMTYAKPDFLIVVDALASDSIDRVCKTIQLTNAGISPGSGIGNERKEISKDIFNIPVFAIGIPMVVDAVTIVSDTIDFMEKHFSYNIRYRDNKKNKLIPFNMQNYLKEKDLFLNNEEKNYFLGKIGTLSNLEKKSLIFDVLTPIGYNLMVTPKEVDFLIDKLSDLISSAINKTIHNKK